MTLEYQTLRRVAIGQVTAPSCGTTSRGSYGARPDEGDVARTVRRHPYRLVQPPGHRSIIPHSLCRCIPGRARSCSMSVMAKHTEPEVRSTAQGFLARLQAAADPADMLADLLEWDELLKSRALNPGTSADLTVATLFVHRLTNILPSARNSG